MEIINNRMYAKLQKKITFSMGEIQDSIESIQLDIIHVLLDTELTEKLHSQLYLNLRFQLEEFNIIYND